MRLARYSSPSRSVRRFFNFFQEPSMPGNWGLIDLDTPASAHTIPSWMDPSKQMQLVFSDEFNTDGRSFYPGDDPYWEAVDLNYWVIKTLARLKPNVILYYRK